MFNLNEQQIQAINHHTGSMLVLSGPGSGKTTVISLRVKTLIEKYAVNPRNILVVTFTKNSADEMKNRFLKLIDNSINYKQVNFGTFHAHFFNIIKRYYNYNLNSILNSSQKLSIIKKVIYNIQKNHKLESLSDMFEVYDKIVESTYINDSENDVYQNLLSEISFVKNTLLDPHSFKSKILSPLDFFLVYTEYENQKNIYHKIDFDDMLTMCYELLKQNLNLRKYYVNKFKYILIDEFQDINKIQYECIKLLLSNEKNLFVVGDDDQSIYSFRGSDPNILLNFSDDFPEFKKVCLNVNYRSTDQIISVANSIIKDNTQRFDKNIVGTNKLGDLPKFIKIENVYDEAEEIVKKIKELQKNDKLLQIAVIYRTNFQATYIIDKMVNSNISYKSKEQILTIYDTVVGKDILAYLKLSLDNSDVRSFMRIIHRPSRYLNKNLLLNITKDFNNKTCTSILDFALNKNDLEYWQYEKLEDLKFDIQHIKTLNTYNAIEYILNHIHYKDFLVNYSDYKKIDYDNLKTMSEQMLETSKIELNISDYIRHTKKVLKNIDSTYHENKNNNAITLTTIHGSKGLEFDVVFILSCVESIIPHERSCNSEFHIEEERRLLYVAMTRAKQQLNIGIVKSLKSSKNTDDIKHSRFLNNILK
ncbi:MAG: ATP-dependent helicase [bacterium]